MDPFQKPWQDGIIVFYAVQRISLVSCACICQLLVLMPNLSISSCSIRTVVSGCVLAHWSFGSWVLCRIRDKDLLSIYMHLFSLTNIIYWRCCLFFSVNFWLCTKKSVVGKKKRVVGTWTYVQVPNSIELINMIVLRIMLDFCGFMCFRFIFKFL